MGQVVFTAEDAEAWHSQGKAAILVIFIAKHFLFGLLFHTTFSPVFVNIYTVYCMQVRAETSPEDVGGMHAAVGILTERGGMTSHAAVVARGWGKCCVSGCSGIRVNDAEKVT